MLLLITYAVFNSAHAHFAGYGYKKQIANENTKAWQHGLSCDRTSREVKCGQDNNKCGEYSAGAEASMTAIIIDRQYFVEVEDHNLVTCAMGWGRIRDFIVSDWFKSGVPEWSPMMSMTGVSPSSGRSGFMFKVLSKMK